MKLVKVVGLLGVLTLGNSVVAADIGWYGGFGVGRSNSVIDYNNTHRQLAAQGFSAKISDDDQDVAFKLFGGYRLNQWLAVEGGYFDLGDFSYTADTTPSGLLQGSVRARGLNTDLVGFVPLTSRLSALGRAGVTYAKVNNDFSGRGGVVVQNMHSHKYSWNPKVGAGLQYDITPKLAARAEWEHFRLRDEAHGRSTVNTYMAGLVMSFGRAEQAAPVAAPVESQPLTVVQEAPTDSGPALKSANYTEESLFDFDSAELTPDGRTKLDQLATEVRGLPYARVLVVGHASRSGTDEYNMKLSERRALVVSNYLVNPGGLESSRLVVQAKGESEPVTRPDQCVGTDEKNDPELRKCLAADRRVRVEITGSK